MPFYRHAECEAAKLSPKKKDIANALYLVLKRKCQGRKNSMCYKKLMKEVIDTVPTLPFGHRHYETDIVNVSRQELWAAVNWLRLNEVLPVLSWAKGVYVANDYDEWLQGVRLIASQAAATLASFDSMVAMTRKKFGDDAIPADVNDFLDTMYEQDKELGIDDDEWEDEDYD